MAPLLHPEETMLQFTYKLKLTERVKAKSSRHPRYNPVKDGRAGIRGGCSTCFSLYDLHQARIALDAAQREFVRRAGPWARQREPRQRKAADATEEPPFILRTERLRVQPLCFLVRQAWRVARKREGSSCGGYFVDLPAQARSRPWWW